MIGDKLNYNNKPIISSYMESIDISMNSSYSLPYLSNQEQTVIYDIPGNAKSLNLRTLNLYMTLQIDQFLTNATNNVNAITTSNIIYINKTSGKIRRVKMYTKSSGTNIFDANDLHIMQLASPYINKKTIGDYKHYELWGNPNNELVSNGTGVITNNNLQQMDDIITFPTVVLNDNLYGSGTTNPPVLSDNLAGGRVISKRLNCVINLGEYIGSSLLKQNIELPITEAITIEITFAPIDAWCMAHFQKAANFAPYGHTVNLTNGTVTNPYVSFTNAAGTVAPGNGVTGYSFGYVSAGTFTAGNIGVNKMSLRVQRVADDTINAAIYKNAFANGPIIIPYEFVTNTSYPYTGDANLTHKVTAGNGTLLRKIIFITGEKRDFGIGLQSTLRYGNIQYSDGCILDRVEIELNGKKCVYADIKSKEHTVINYGFTDDDSKLYSQDGNTTYPYRNLQDLSFRLIGNNFYIPYSFEDVNEDKFEGDVNSGIGTNFSEQLVSIKTFHTNDRNNSTSSLGFVNYVYTFCTKYLEIYPTYMKVVG